MKIDEFIAKHYEVNSLPGIGIISVRRPRVICNDGFSISVQGSKNHYCEPRENWVTGYTSLELGFPSEAEELIAEYAEGDDLTHTVYGYVPVEIVDQLIEKHGGIKE